MDRHDRQARLAEIGARGQARIAAATVEVSLIGLAGEVATRYLAGAGVGRLRVREARLASVAMAVDPSARVDIEETPAASDADTPGALDFHDPVAREVGVGAREALRALRRILEGAS